MKEGDAGSVFLPALYPGTEHEATRSSSWAGLPIGAAKSAGRGVGMKIFFVGSDESSILDWRNWN